MIGIPETGGLSDSVISAVCFEGLSVTTTDGKPAQFAIIDEHGNVIESGKIVAKEAWNVTIACYKNFLQGSGHLRIHTSPNEQIKFKRKAA
jgi:hypothetical protein